MRLRYFWLLFLILLAAPKGFTQSSTPAAANQVNKTDGAGGWTLAPYNSGGSGGITSSIFNIASSCNGVANCLAWVDDDTTDNCGTATTAFFAAVNASTSDEIFLNIQGSGTGKGYKLASCNIPLTGNATTAGPPGTINVNSAATIDCGQTSGSNCIQMGKTSCPTTTFYSTGCHDVTWRGGAFMGGVSLSKAVMEIEQGMFINIIDDVEFINTGAGNATIGSCTNYSVAWDTWIGGQEFSRNKYYGTVKGQCFTNNNDVTGGANTILFTNNVISHTGGANSCGSIAAFDSSSHSTYANNLIYGFSSNITLAVGAAPAGPYTQDGGWMITNNDLDYSSGCNAAVNASIQFTGSHLVGPVTLTNNNVQSSPFIQQASGTSTSMTGWVVTGNTTYNTSNEDLIGGTTTEQLGCVPFGGQSTATYTCYLGANPGFNQAQSTGTVFPGWILFEGNSGHYYSGPQTANLSSVNVNGGVALVGSTNVISCQVILTIAATSSSTLPSCTVHWTDLLTGTAESQTITSTSTANAVGTQSSGSTGNVSIAGASNISVTTSGYVSSGATAMSYTVFADITRVF